MSEHLAIILTMWGLFTGVGWIVWVVTTNMRRKRVAEIQAERQNKLLERLSNSQDLAEFLKTEAGSRLLDSPPVEKGSPFSRILGSIQVGLVLSLLGIALLTLSGVIRGAWDELIVFGSITFSLGLGFIISAAVSYTLSRAWGLLGKDSSGKD